MGPVQKKKQVNTNKVIISANSVEVLKHDFKKLNDAYMCVVESAGITKIFESNTMLT